MHRLDLENFISQTVPADQIIRYKPNYTLRVSNFRLLKLNFLPAYACPSTGMGSFDRGLLMLRFQLPDYPDPKIILGCSILT